MAEEIVRLLLKNYEKERSVEGAAALSPAFAKELASRMEVLRAIEASPVHFPGMIVIPQEVH